MATAKTSAQFNGRRRIRKFYGNITEVTDMPNLIEVQMSSYDSFLIVEEPEGGRLDEGLQAVFNSVFPIKDFTGAAQLDFVRYDFEPPKYDVEECRQRDMTYSAPLKVTLRLIVFDIDEDTQAKSVKDIKEQEVYMGDMPLMTGNGTFIINGTGAGDRFADAPLAGRLFRSRQGQNPFFGQAFVCLPRDPVSRFVARHRIRSPKTSFMPASTAAANCRRPPCSWRSAWMARISSIISTTVLR